MVTGNYQEVVIKTTQPEFNLKPKRGVAPRKEYFRAYYTKNKQKYLLSQQNRRLKLKSLKPKTLPSPFQQTKQDQLLKLLVNPRSFVPVPTKLKHPIIKN
jgi:hypothetical protein